MIQKLGKDTTIATHFSKSLNPMAMQMGRGSSYDCVATLVFLTCHSRAIGNYSHPTL